MKTQNQSQTSVDSDDSSLPPSDAKHTPTPWVYIDPAYDQGESGMGASDMRGRRLFNTGVCSPFPLAESQANARLIVECVNSHASLVADRDALRKALELEAAEAEADAEYYHLIDNRGRQHVCLMRAKRCRAALASSAK